MGRINLKHCTIKVRDGSGTPVEIEVKIGAGNLTWTENMAYEYIPDRGSLDDVVEGDDTPMQVDFQFRFDYLRSRTSNPPTVYEALHRIGNAQNWVSSDADPCHPYCVDLIVEHVPNCTVGDDETYVFPDFRVESINPDIGGMQVSASGRCNAIRPIITRTAKS